MKISLVALLALLISCGLSERQLEDESNEHAEPTDTVAAVLPETWIYFSQHTFPGNNVLQGMLTPNVKRQLNVEEKSLLDSVIAGHFDPAPDTIGVPKLGCYWPKHAVQIFSGSSTSAINICFECSSTRSSDQSLSRVPLKAWEVFFLRIGIPVRTGYPEFFGRAKNDSVFRNQNGIFRF